jgi:hypothetical protein
MARLKNKQNRVRTTAALMKFTGDSGSGGHPGLVPPPGAGDSGKFLQGDGSWATITIPTVPDAATQADQETGTSTTVWVSPGRQHYHPSAAKAWGLVTHSGGTPTLTTGYGVASISDGGAGVTNINLSTAFSSVNYIVVVTLIFAGSAVASRSAYYTVTDADTFQVVTEQADGTNADTSFSFVCYGDI